MTEIFDLEKTKFPDPLHDFYVSRIETAEDGKSVSFVFDDIYFYKDEVSEEYYEKHKAHTSCTVTAELKWAEADDIYCLLTDRKMGRINGEEIKLATLAALVNSGETELEMLYSSQSFREYTMHFALHGKRAKRCWCDIELPACKVIQEWE